jgi:hypothetical protein
MISFVNVRRTQGRRSPLACTVPGMIPSPTSLLSLRAGGIIHPSFDGLKIPEAGAETPQRRHCEECTDVLTTARRT